MDTAIDKEKAAIRNDILAAAKELFPDDTEAEQKKIAQIAWDRAILKVLG